MQKISFYNVGATIGRLRALSERPYAFHLLLHDGQPQFHISGTVECFVVLLVIPVNDLHFRPLCQFIVRRRKPFIDRLPVQLIQIVTGPLAPFCFMVMVPYGMVRTIASFSMISSCCCRVSMVEGTGFRFGMVQTQV